MDIKSVNLTGLKAGGDDGLEEGQFLAYFSTWTRTPDSYGDVVAKGAFTETFDNWKAGGNTMPILFGHDLVDPFSNLGGALELSEDDHGALVKGQLDLANPKAAQVYRMLKGKRISQLSFAYDVLDDGIVELDEVKADGNKVTARELRKMVVHEVSIVPFGANSDTEVLAVKALAAGIKAGKTISTKNLESLTAARDAIDSVIKAAGESDPTEEDAKASRSDSDVETHGRKASESATRSAHALILTTTSY